MKTEKTKKMELGAATDNKDFGSGTLPVFIIDVLKGRSYTEVKGETYASLAMKVRQEG